MYAGTDGKERRDGVISFDRRFKDRVRVEGGMYSLPKTSSLSSVPC